jgi:outer membrane protein assembly factor BamB
MLWQSPATESATVLGVADDRILTVGTQLEARDVMTGKLQWSTSLPGDAEPRRHAQLALDERTVLLGTLDSLYLLDTQAGTLIRHWSLPVWGLRSLTHLHWQNSELLLSDGQRLQYFGLR